MDRELREMSTQWRNSLIEAGKKERAKMGVLYLIKRGLQVLHALLAFSFVVLALVEFAEDPPYFDAVAQFNRKHVNATIIPKDTFYNLTRSASTGIRRIMDFPILFMFMAYFVVLLWRHAWGAWSVLMSLAMTLTLLSFVTIHYAADDYFDWRFFSSRGYGILLQVFCFSFGWNTIAIAVFRKLQWYPFQFSTNKPATFWGNVLLVIWNFFAVLVFLFFCLLIWFSRLYFSWACVESLNDVLLMCQFTNFVECYACEEAVTCTNLDACVRNTKPKHTFHCQSPLAGLHDVNEAFCVFNYNIGFFTFIMVFAFVGGTYFFLSNILNFFVRCTKYLTAQFVVFMNRKTRPHIDRLKSYSVSKIKRQGINQDNSYNITDEDEEERQDLLGNGGEITDD